MANEKSKKGGRPSLYSRGAGMLAALGLRAGLSFRELAATQLPRSAAGFVSWRQRHPEFDRLARAGILCAMRAEIRAECESDEAWRDLIKHEAASYGVALRNALARQMPDAPRDEIHALGKHVTQRRAERAFHRDRILALLDAALFGHLSPAVPSMDENAGLVYEKLLEGAYDEELGRGEENVPVAELARAYRDPATVEELKRTSEEYRRLLERIDPDPQEGGSDDG